MSEAELQQLTAERGALESRLAALTDRIPSPASLALADRWAAASVFAQLDPAVRAGWNSYLEQAASVVLRTDPGLRAAVALRQRYDRCVDTLANDARVSDKAAALTALRTGPFQALFGNAVQADMWARFETTSAKLMDRETIARRLAYHSALAAAITRRDPTLGAYGAALVEKELTAQKICARLDVLTGQLSALGRLPLPAVGQEAEHKWVWLQESFLGSAFHSAFVSCHQDILLIEILMVVIGVLLTHPVELRRGRWWKIGISLALVYWAFWTLTVPASADLGARASNIFAFLGFTFPAILLSGLWTPEVVFYVCEVFMHLVDSPVRNRSRCPVCAGSIERPAGGSSRPRCG